MTTAKETPTPEEKKRGKRTPEWRSTPPRLSKLLPQRPLSARKGIPIEAIEEALWKAGGLYGDAARLLGMSRAGLRSRVLRHERLREVRDEAQDEFLDMSESVLMKAVKKGNLGAACFVLKTLGRTRGYVERQEVESTTVEPVKIYVPQKDETDRTEKPIPVLEETPETEEPPPAS